MYGRFRFFIVKDVEFVTLFEKKRILKDRRVSYIVILITICVSNLYWVPKYDSLDGVREKSMYFSRPTTSSHRCDLAFCELYRFGGGVGTNFLQVNSYNEILFFTANILHFLSIGSQRRCFVRRRTIENFQSRFIFFYVNGNTRRVFA